VTDLLLGNEGESLATEEEKKDQCVVDQIRRTSGVEFAPSPSKANYKGQEVDFVVNVGDQEFGVDGAHVFGAECTSERLLQLRLRTCYSGVTLVLHWCYSDVTVVLQWCYSRVTVLS
jgi:hypothetical protein